MAEGEVMKFKLRENCCRLRQGDGIRLQSIGIVRTMPMVDCVITEEFQLRFHLWIPGKGWLLAHSGRYKQFCSVKEAHEALLAECGGSVWSVE